MTPIIRSKFSKVILALAGTVVFLVVYINSNKDVYQDENSQNIEQKVEPLIHADNNVSNIGSSKKINSIPAPLNIKVIKNSDDLLDLVKGERFSLMGDSQEGDVNLLLMVKKVDKQSRFTQIEAVDENGVVAVITLTNSFTNVFIKTANSIFEYASNNFSGTVNQVTDLNLADDIYIRKTSPISVQEKPQIKN